MNRYLLVTSDQLRYPLSKRPAGADEDYSSPYHLCIQTGTLEGDAVLLIANPTLELQDPSDRLIGTWELDGTPVGTIDQDLYQQIRPLGNDTPRNIYDESGAVVGQTRSGNATRHLGYNSVAGDSQRQLDQAGHLYPDSNQPFPITFRHKYFGGHADPNHDGWGWRAEMDSDFVPVTRDPAGYFVAIYNNAECTVDDFWYQAGGFVEMESEWQTDADGNALTVWGCEYDQAYLGQGQKQDIHHGVCKGSIHNQHGYETLHVDEDADHYLFWEHTQGVATGGSVWADTGATIEAQYGQAYKISDEAVCAALIPGQKVRFAETGDETTFTELRPGFADEIQIDPFVQAAVGDALWSFE